MEKTLKNIEEKRNRKGKAAIILALVIVAITLFSISLVSSASWGVGMIAYWNMTNSSSTNIPDSTGNSHNITLTTGFGKNPQMVPGLLGWAQNGSNSTSFMNVTGNLTALRSLSRNFSIFMWVNFSTGSPSDPNFHQFFNYGSWSWGIQSSKLVIQNETSGTIVGGTQDAFNYKNSKWYFIGLVVNQTNFTFYINGTATNTYDANIFAANSTGIISFRDGETPFLTLPYAFDEVGIWGRSINQDEITKIYNNHIGLIYSPNDPNIIFDDQTYNENATEGSTETLSLNVTYNTTYYPNSVGYLIYNNTVYSSTKTNGGTTKFTSSVNVPQVTATTNKSFYWSIGLINSTGTYFFNTSSLNQTVFNLAIDDCSSNTNILFNFTMVDEDSQLKINGVTGNTLMKTSVQLYSIGTGLNILNYSNNFSKINPIGLCSPSSLGNSTLRLEALIEYSSDGRFVEFYNIQNYTLTNSTSSQNITLYNLNNTLGQEFKITYKDSGFSTVPGAIIQIQRQYIQEGLFKTIEIPKISSAGYTIGHLIRSDQVYNLIVMKDGIVLDSFENIVANCQNPSLQECEININSLSGTVSPNDFTNNNGFSSTLTYDKDTRTITSVFTIASGVSATTILNATLFNGYGNVSVCSDSLFASGGTLSCTVPTTFGNSSVMIKITSGGVQKRFAILSIDADPNDIYQINIVFIGLILMITIIGMGITDNPMVLGIMMIIGSVMLVTLNVLSFTGILGGVSQTGAVGATLLYLIIAIVLIFIKGANRQ